MPNGLIIGALPSTVNKEAHYFLSRNAGNPAEVIAKWDGHQWKYIKDKIRELK